MVIAGLTGSGHIWRKAITGTSIRDICLPTNLRTFSGSGRWSWLLLSSGSPLASCYPASRAWVPGYVADRQRAPVYSRALMPLPACVVRQLTDSPGRDATEVERPRFDLYGGSGSRVSPVWARNPVIRSGRCWMRWSWFRTVPASWSTVQARRRPPSSTEHAGTPSVIKQTKTSDLRGAGIDDHGIEAT